MRKERAFGGTIDLLSMDPTKSEVAVREDDGGFGVRGLRFGYVGNLEHSGVGDKEPLSL